MIEFLLDGQQAVIDAKTKAAITITIADIEDPSSSSSGFTKTIEVPINDHNRYLFGFTEQVHSVEQFNNSNHTGEIRSNGITVVSGQVQMQSYVNNNYGGGYYKVVILGSTYEWIKNANRQINELVSDEVVVYTKDKVYTNSIAPTTDNLIRFVPVDRGAFFVKDASGNFIPRTNIEIEDYHPFLNLWKLLQLIFEGYTIKTSLHELFQKIYIPGYMPEGEDVTFIKENNDFKIGTSYEGGGAGVTGQTYFDIYNVLTDDNVGYFVKNNTVTRIIVGQNIHTYFKPINTLTARFDINVAYKTDVRTEANSKRLVYADTFVFGRDVNSSEVIISQSTEESYKLDLSESDEFKNSRSWTLGNKYSAAYIKLKTQLHYIKIVHRQQIRRGSAITTNETTLLGLFDFDIEAGDWVSCSNTIDDSAEILSDAIYGVRFDNGASEEITSGNPYVEQFMRISIDDFNPSSGYRTYVTFNKQIASKRYTIDAQTSFSFGCAFEYSRSDIYDAPFNILIGNATTLSPDFNSGGIGLGSEVSVSTIGGTNTQLQLIQSLRQMFNLMFYTNSRTKQVFIEPRELFYNHSEGNVIAGEIDESTTEWVFGVVVDEAGNEVVVDEVGGDEAVDWSGNIDYSKSIEMEELGADIGNALILAYAEGGDVQKRYNRKNQIELGTLRLDLQNKIAKDPKELRNELFAPAIIRIIESMGFKEGVIQNISEIEKMVITDAEMNITPVVAQFVSIATRTQGSDIAQYLKYPVMKFQDIANGVNLGFKDIQNGAAIVKGLGQYYQYNVTMYDSGRRIIAQMVLNPRDIEPIIFPNSQYRDLRGTYKLRINGEIVYCRLEKIADYDASSRASTKCYFLKD